MPSSATRAASCTTPGGGSGGEARLHDKGSIGIGGHINPVDRQSGHDDVSTYLAGVEREIREELVIDGGCTQRVLGVINDDSNEVGARAPRHRPFVRTGYGPGAR